MRIPCSWGKNCGFVLTTKYYPSKISRYTVHVISFAPAMDNLIQYNTVYLVFKMRMSTECEIAFFTGFAKFSRALISCVHTSVYYSVNAAMKTHCFNRNLFKKSGKS